MYTKVFSSMFHGSLCTTGPWEALVTFQQMLILADKFGVVDMTADAIARMTTVPLDIIEKGIAALEQPDPYSRNETLDGRRIKRIADHRNWGWEIVNFQHYNSIRTAEDRREYQKRYQREYRAKRKQNVNNVNFVNHELTKSTKKTPHTHSQAQAQTKKEYSYKNKNTRKVGVNKKTSWPSTFTLTEELKQYALNQGIKRPEEEFENFQLKAQSKNYQYANWNAAWKSWCRSEFQQASKLEKVEYF